MCTQCGVGEGETEVAQIEQQLYTAVSSTSSWLDGVENNVFSGSVLLPENADTQLQKQEVIRVTSFNSLDQSKKPDLYMHYRVCSSDLVK